MDALLMADRKTEDELREIISRASKTLNAANGSSVWKHRKSGVGYRIRTLTLREEDLVPLVMYARLGSVVSFVRPVDDFLNSFGPVHGT